jgi:hypothetical protein
MHLRGGPGISETTFRAMVDGKCICMLSHFYDVVSLTTACRCEVFFKVSERFHSDQGGHDRK